MEAIFLLPLENHRSCSFAKAWNVLVINRKKLSAHINEKRHVIYIYVMEAIQAVPHCNGIPSRMETCKLVMGKLHILDQFSMLWRGKQVIILATHILQGFSF